MSTADMVDCRRRFKEGRWNKQLLEDIWKRIDHSSDAPSIMLSYDIQHCLSGLQQEHLHWFDRWQQSQKRLCWPLQWRLMSAELHLGLRQEAHIRRQNLEKQCWSARRVFSLQHFPLVLNDLCHREHTQKNFPTSGLMRLAADLQQRTTTLAQWCRASLPEQSPTGLPARIAVVGNGPSLIGTKAGESIDAADLVVRFNEIHTEASIKHDTGQRTDLWVVSPAFKINGNKMPCQALCLSGPAPLMRSSRYWQSLARLPLSSLTIAPLDSWYSLTEALEAPPSAGILVLDTLIRHCPDLLTNIHGFTTDSREAEDTSRAGNHYGDSHLVSTRHDWQRESSLIQKWIRLGRLSQA